VRLIFRNLRQRLKAFAPDLADVAAKSPSRDVRIAAAGALGSIEGNPEVTAEALGRLLADPEVTVRRATAEALGNALQVILKLTTGPYVKVDPLEDAVPDNVTDEQRRARAEPLNSIIHLVPVATRGLDDGDAAVRRQCVQACRRASQGLLEVTPAPPPLLPPQGVPLDADDRERVLRERGPVFAQLGALNTVVGVFRDRAPAWTRAATKPDQDPTVRIEVRHIFEDLALTVQKMRRLESSFNYPDLPQEKEGTKGTGAAPEGARGRASPAALLGEVVSRVPPAVPSPDSSPVALDAPVALKDARLPQAAHIPPPGGRMSPAADVAQKAPEDLPPPKKVADDPRVPLQQAVDLARGALEKGLSDPNVRVRLASLDALETMSEPAAAPALPVLVKALRDPNLFVRWQAARIVGNLAPRQAELAVPALTRLLTPQEDLSIRLAVVTALGKYGPDAEPAVGALTRSLTGGTIDLQQATIQSLEKIGTKAARALPAVAERLKDPVPAVRAEAARVLGRFGPLAADILPALRRALFDPDADVRRAASDAVLAIDKR
jgi:HEAT repeat protein